MRERDSETTGNGHGEVDALDAWAMIESSPDGMLLADEHGRILVVNTRIEKLFGYDRCELVGRLVEDLMPARHRRPHLAHRTRYRATPAVRAMGEGLSLSGLRRDGSEFPIEVSLSPINRGGESRVVATVRDISERLAADLAYRKTVEAFQVAFHGAPVPVGLATIDRDGMHLSSVNEACGLLLGYGALELIGRDLRDLVVESDRARVTALAHKAMAGEVTAGSFETQLVRADGSTVPVWAHSSILEADPDGPTTVLTHVIDLTERQRIEREREGSRLWTESLAEVQAAVLDELPLDEILTLVARRARLLTGATLAFVAGSDHGRDRHRVIATDPIGSGRYLPETITVDETLRRALAGETARITDFDPFGEIDPTDGASNDYRSNGPMSGIVVRIATSHDPALLFALSDEEDGFNPERIAMVEALATEAATALELTRARQERSRLALLEDRELMAHDFHDLVIQRLFAAGMSLHSVRSLADNEEISGRVDQVIAEIDHAIAELRSAIFRLTPDLPATSARRLADVVVRAREWFEFEPTLRFEGDTDAIPEPVLEQMIPTLTEMLSNVARHAEADRVDVVISGDDDGTTLQVTDNGIGFDPHAVNRSGLANLVARAQRLGGSCTIVTGPGGGTAVTWTVPG